MYTVNVTSPKGVNSQRDWTLAQALNDAGLEAAQLEHRGFTPKSRRPVKGEFLHVVYVKGDEEVTLFIITEPDTLMETMTRNTAKSYGL